MRQARGPGIQWEADALLTTGTGNWGFPFKSSVCLRNFVPKEEMPCPSFLEDSQCVYPRCRGNCPHNTLRILSCAWALNS